ncbi:methylmalonyl-CoA epimerase [Haloferax sulfurifontis]|uniref:Lactoylglutathione lyase n=2 Tax=Haloferax sulfurifontis TaxID=255616 RepID=M0IM44_9EURY|nr:methylmalonyl-CoA epimerase [Haloferax sulfurifontis]ELZ97886.1 lactoylglutathione lyase [Haloferax sulfurifontis ATCC BAA-897]GGC57865.1 methylmalonyl-CoA epimerase [Haloferax sulfurifontis]
MHFDHVGIATPDAAGLAALFAELFDAPVAHEETFDGMSVVFLELENGYFELLEPHEEGAISKFLDKRGGGIHHVAVETDDIEGALRTAEAAGVDRIDEEPRPGAWGHEVAFLHPKSTGGVLVEFVSH